MSNLNYSWPINPIPLSSGDSFRYDWMNEDGIATDVTYTPSTASGLGAPVSVAYMVTTPVRVEEPKDSYGKYRRWVVSLQFPIDYITFAPKPRDAVNWGFRLYSTGPTITFNICKINDTPYLGSPYMVTADYMDFIPELSDTVSILQPTVVASPTGARTVTQTSIAGPMAAAIEPINQYIREGFGALINPEQYMCYLTNAISDANDPGIVKVGALVRDQNNVLYDILEVTDRERLDLKTALRIEKKL